MCVFLFYLESHYIKKKKVWSASVTVLEQLYRNNAQFPKTLTTNAQVHNRLHKLKAPMSKLNSQL